MAPDGSSRARQGLSGLTGFLCLALIGCGTDSSAPAGPGAAGVDSSATALRAVFTDPQLQTAVQAAAGGPDSLLTLDRAARLTQLDAGGRGITTLGGIGQLSGLQVLVLRDNRISDLSPLSTLTALQYLDLENNRVTSLEPLAGLTKLIYLSMSYCHLRDLSPLAGLTRLASVRLDHNQIEDISPLLQVTMTVYLPGNPLSRESLEVHVPALRARGVTVDLTE